MLAFAVPIVAAYAVSKLLFRHVASDPAPLTDIPPSMAPPPLPRATAPPVVPSGTVVFEREFGIDSDFLLIDHDLEPLAAPVPENEPRPVQVAGLVSLADKLRSKPEPASRWSDLFRQTGDHLAGLMPMSARLGPLLENPTLRAKPDFDDQFVGSVNRVRACAQARDIRCCDETIVRLRDCVVHWHSFFDDWVRVRGNAAETIDLAEKVPQLSDGWLSHGLRHDFQDRETGQALVWLPWGALEQPDVLAGLTNWIAMEIDHAAWAFTAVCTMSSTGAPLATMLSERLRTRLLVINDHDFKFLPGSGPRQGDKLVLVDSLVATGHHLDLATATIQDAGARVAGAVLICRNDLLPDGKLEGPIIEYMLRQKKIIWLFEMSDLYSVWKSSLFPEPHAGS